MRRTKPDGEFEFLDFSVVRARTDPVSARKAVYEAFLSTSGQEIKDKKVLSPCPIISSFRPAFLACWCQPLCCTKLRARARTHTHTHTGKHARTHADAHAQTQAHAFVARAHPNPMRTRTRMGMPHTRMRHAHTRMIHPLCPYIFIPIRV